LSNPYIPNSEKILTENNSISNGKYRTPPKTGAFRSPI
jgi:hypothetical protein